MKYLKTVATTSGIVAWFTFDTNSQANSIINGYTGTLASGAKISASGKGAPISGEQNNTGLSLNGTSAFVNTNLTTQQEFTTAATFNVWVNLGSNPSASGHIYSVLAKSQFQNDLDLQIEGDGSVHFYTDTGTSTSFKPSSLTGWHMVTAEFDTAAKIRKIFWDGKQVASSTPGAHSASTGTFSIGESDVFTGRFFNGSIDEVSLWNRAHRGRDHRDLQLVQINVIEHLTMQGCLWLCHRRSFGFPTEFTESTEESGRKRDWELFRRM